MTEVGGGAAETAGPFSRFEWMLAWRYLRSRRRDTFISVISALTLIGVALGVATLIVVMSVMSGFRDELLVKILGLNGHFTAYPIDAVHALTAAAAIVLSLHRSEGFGLVLAEAMLVSPTVASNPAIVSGFSRVESVDCSVLRALLNVPNAETWVFSEFCSLVN